MSSEDGESNFGLPPDAADYVDIGTFEQILEMDDEADREFSSQLVFGFFEQAATTFDQMDEKIEEKDMPQLSALGHFLKGSSATLGLYKIKDACEKIQHLGAMTNETGDTPVDDVEENLQKIKDIMPQMKKDYAEVEGWLRDFFGAEAAGEES